MQCEYKEHHTWNMSHSGWTLNTCTRDMSQTARRARVLLVDESADRIASFVMRRLTGEGGFRGRSKETDLYYTLFGLECLRALDCTFPVDRVARYLLQFGDGQGLDFVHLACLARCLANLTDSGEYIAAARAVLANLGKYRSPNGGYRLTPHALHDSIYASFLAYLAYEDVGEEIHDPQGLVRCIDGLRTADNAYADLPGLSTGITTVTAAAVVLLHYLGEPVDPGVGQWLVDRVSPGGGFKAGQLAPIPDLLSTATALYALKTMNYPMSNMAALVDPSLSFIEDVWHESGGFCGHILDGAPDCEYTYYGLLCLGILTLDEGCQ